MAHYAVSVASFGVKSGPPLGRGATQSFSRFLWDNDVLRPGVSNDWIVLPDFGDGLYKFAPPEYFEIREDATSGHARGSSLTDAKITASKVHPSWGHGSARQLRGIFGDAKEANQ